MSGLASRTQSDAKGGNSTRTTSERTTTSPGNKSGGKAYASPNDVQKGHAASQGTTSEAQPCPLHPHPIISAYINYVGYGIYVGNAKSVCGRFLQANGITHVLSVGTKPEEELSEKKFKTKYVEAEDGPNANLKKIFDASFSFIDEGTKGTNKILVHCWAGYSRSITVVTGYLHHKKNFSWKQAYLWVADKRPQLWPHPAFLEYMAEQASKDNGGHETFTIDDFTLPGQRVLEGRLEATRKYLDSLDLKKVFSGCEKDKRKTEPLVFWTEEGKETDVES